MISALPVLNNDSTNSQDSLLAFEIIYVEAVIIGAAKNFRAITRKGHGKNAKSSYAWRQM